MKQGGWVFISHSHQDIAKVREIRNYLEKLGLEPLMFYLKCLSDENEIEDLIKREIDERDWFIYVDSNNARNSKWVKTEREYIENFADKKVFTINLNDDLEKQLKNIEHIAKQMKVFISYSSKDRALKERISQRLLQKDMLIIDEEDNVFGGFNYQMQAKKMIKAAAREGFVLLLVTENSYQSVYIEYEIKYAKKSNGKIIPVYVGEAKLNPNLLNTVGSSAGVRLSHNPTEEELDVLIKEILKGVEFYDSSNNNNCFYRVENNGIRLFNISRIDRKTLLEHKNLEWIYLPDSVIYITMDAFKDHSNIIVKCSPNSYAEHYCIKNGIKFELE